jgi:hypothetical protein
MTEEFFEMFGKINFRSENAITWIINEPVKLEDRIVKHINYYNIDAVDFDLQIVPISELRHLTTIFQRKTFSETYDEKMLLQQTITVFRRDLSKTLSVVLGMVSLSDHLRNRYFHVNDPDEDHLKVFFITAEELLFKMNRIVASFKEICRLVDSVKILKRVEYKFVIQEYIKLFHQTDIMLEYTFKIYLTFQSKFTTIAYIYQQYEWDILYNSRNLLIANYHTLHEDYTRNNELNWGLEEVDFTVGAKKPLLDVFVKLEDIIHRLIDYKLEIRDSLSIHFTQKAVSDVLYDNCKLYFDRFYELYLLKNEMILDVVVGYTNNENEKELIKINCYENNLIPAVVRQSHRFVMLSRNELKTYGRAEISKVSKEIIKTNQKSE